MPITYVCKRCGYVLYRFDKVGQDCYGLPSPMEVINMHGGICPRCKADLRPPAVEEIIEKIRYTFIGAGRSNYALSLQSPGGVLAETA